MTGVQYRPLLEVLVSDESFESLQSEWDELLAATAAPTVFLTWAWVSSWRATLGKDHRFRIVTARRPEDGSLVGLAPFAVARRRGRALLAHRVLQLIGSGPAAPDHLDLMVRVGHEHVAGLLWGAVLDEPSWDLVDLDRLRPESLLAGVAIPRLEHSDRLMELSGCPTLQLPETWEDYEATLGRNLRQNLRRYRRKLDWEAGAPVVERLVSEPQEVAETMAALTRLHQEVKAASGSGGAFGDLRMVAFCQQVAASFLRGGRLRLYRLDVGTDPIAVILCFRYGDVVSFYQTGYDRKYGKYGPGRRIMAYAIASVINEGAREFDFLRGDEPYKQAWGAEARFDTRILVPVSVKGRVILSVRRTVKRMRALGSRPR